MKNILIIGAGGHSRVVISILQEMGNLNVVGVFDPRFSGEEENILGCSVLGHPSAISNYPPSDHSIVLAIGSNSIRRELSQAFNDYDFPNIIHPLAYISPSANLGNGNFIAPFAHIGPKVSIGSHNILNTSSNVEHESVIGDFCQLGPGSVICGRCCLHNGIFIGANATVIENLSLATSVTIGAGSVIIRSVNSPSSVVVGVPGHPL